MELAPPTEAVAGIGPKANAQSPRRVKWENAVVSRGVQNCAAETTNESGRAEDIHGNESAPANGGPGR